MDSISSGFHLCCMQTLKVFLKPVDERCRDKMNTVKAERKDKAPYTEKINTYVPSGWSVHSTFAYGDVPDPLKMYRGKDCVEKFEKGKGNQ